MVDSFFEAVVEIKMAFDAAGRVCSFFFAILLLWCNSAHSEAQWTIMAYMAGDNNLSDALVNDVVEMMEVGSSDQVNVVVQAELSPIFSSIEHNGHTYRFKVLKNGLEWHDLGMNLDMASPTTLADFIGWAVSNYPARHYALFLWDHGLGWAGGGGDDARSGGVRGLLEDRTSHTFMSVQELSQALNQAGVFFDLIEFDACLMGMLEVAMSVHQFTRYITFSEASEPGDGDPYDKILHKLVSQPGMAPWDFAKMVAREYVEHYKTAKEGLVSVTKSAIDTDVVTDMAKAVALLAEALDRRLADTEFVVELSSLRGKVQSFFGLPGSVDLYDLCGKLAMLGGSIKSKAEDVQGLFGADSVYEHHYTPQNEGSGLVAGNSVSNAHGIAIYFPWYKDAAYSTMHEYQQLCSFLGLSEWAHFLEGLRNKLIDSHVVTTHGDFVIAAYWTNFDGSKSAADLDLYVVEPAGAYTPWMGQTTPNGFFSADSLDSGDNYEIYTARQEVERGLYLPVINLYDDGPGLGVWAYCFYMPDKTLNSITTWGPHSMDLLFPAPDPEDWDEWVMYMLSMNFYSNWWIPGEVQKLFSRASFTATIEFWEKIREQYLWKHARMRVNE